MSLLRTKVIGVREKVSCIAYGAAACLASADYAGRTVNEWLDDLTDRERVRALLHAIVRLATHTNAPDVLSAEVAIRQMQLGLGLGVHTSTAGGNVSSTDSPVSSSPVGGEICRDDGMNDLPEAARSSLPWAARPADRVGDRGASVPERGRHRGERAHHLAPTKSPTHRFVIGVDEPIYLGPRQHGGDVSRWVVRVCHSPSTWRLATSRIVRDWLRSPDTPRSHPMTSSTSATFIA